MGGSVSKFCDSDDKESFLREQRQKQLELLATHGVLVPPSLFPFSLSSSSSSSLASKLVALQDEVTTTTPWNTDALLLLLQQQQQQQQPSGGGGIYRLQQHHSFLEPGLWLAGSSANGSSHVIAAVLSGKGNNNNSGLMCVSHSLFPSTNLLLLAPTNGVPPSLTLQLQSMTALHQPPLLSLHGQLRANLNVNGRGWIGGMFQFRNNSKDGDNSDDVRDGRMISGRQQRRRRRSNNNNNNNAIRNVVLGSGVSFQLFARPPFHNTDTFASAAAAGSVHPHDDAITSIHALGGIDVHGTLVAVSADISTRDSHQRKHHHHHQQELEPPPFRYCNDSNNNSNNNNNNPNIRLLLHTNLNPDNSNNNWSSSNYINGDDDDDDQQQQQEQQQQSSVPPPLWFTARVHNPFGSSISGSNDAAGAGGGNINNNSTDFSLQVSQTLTFDRYVWNIWEDRAPFIRNQFAWTVEISNNTKNSNSSESDLLSSHTQTTATTTTATTTSTSPTSSSSAAAPSSTTKLTAGAFWQLNRNVAIQAITTPSEGNVRAAVLFQRWRHPRLTCSVIGEYNMWNHQGRFVGIGLELGGITPPPTPPSSSSSLNRLRNAFSTDGLNSDDTTSANNTETKVILSAGVQQ